MTKLIIGCGYFGCQVAQRWLDADQTVVAVTRIHTRAEELKRQGIVPVVADITQPATLVGKLPEAHTVLFAVGYDSASGRTRREYYVNGLQNVLSAISPTTQRFILISSTAVYGQTQGEWVDENSPCLPETESGIALLEAENVLAASQFGACAVILRLAGIYGPGRLIRRTNDLLAGTPIIAPKDSFLNLIHVEDAASIVVATEKMAKPPCKYIASDGHPVKYQDYIAYLVHLLKAPNPQFLEPSPDRSSKTRNLTNKRLSNAKILSELGIQLKYPSYKEGLLAIILPKF